MNFSDFQRLALLTDQFPSSGEPGRFEKASIIPVLGLAGEAGSLLTEYKKLARDGEGYKLFRERVGEELGDILWYVANIASKEKLDLSDIASSCIAKVENRWGNNVAQESLFPHRLLDDNLPPSQQFPRRFRVELSEVFNSDKNRMVQVGKFEGEQFGDPLTDNNAADDGYRFHDVFHLAYVAVLGWSPVMRKMMGRKRLDKDTDEIQDGGRAKVIDEAVSALVFSRAGPDYYRNVRTVDYELLRSIKDITAHLEVSRFPMKDWEQAILAGFDVWNQLRAAGRGVVVGNLLERTLTFEALP